MTTDIRATFDNTQFDVRVCGILKNNGKVLVSTEDDGSQTLTGGAVQIGETTEAALVREFYEETKLKIKPQKLVAIIENFFSFEAEYHQIIFVYEALLAEGSHPNDLVCEEKLDVNWEPLRQVNQLKPAVLNELIHASADQSLVHFVNNDHSIK